MCPNGSKMLAKSLQKSLNGPFNAHLASYLGALGPNLESCWRSWAPSCHQLVAKCWSLGPTCLHKDSNYINTAPQDEKTH